MTVRLTLLAVACLGAFSSTSQASQFNDALTEIREGRPTTGAAIFHNLAISGDSDAMFNLALLYEKGLGLPQSGETALYWAWRARLLGHPKGKMLADQLFLGAGKEARKHVLDKLSAELQETIHEDAPLSYIRLAMVEEALAAKPNQIEVYANSAMAVALGFAQAVDLRDQAAARLANRDLPKAEARLAQLFYAWCDAQETPSISCPEMTEQASN